MAVEREQTNLTEYAINAKITEFFFIFAAFLFYSVFNIEELLVKLYYFAKQFTQDGLIECPLLFFFVN